VGRFISAQQATVEAAATGFRDSVLESTPGWSIDEPAANEK
jgi:hypothetical protein